MFSHITVGTTDLLRAATFYDAVLTPLGLRRRKVAPDGGPPTLCWVGSDSVSTRLYVYVSQDGNAASAGNGSMVAFNAPDPQTVEQAYAAGLATFGTNDGEPGPRPHYGEGYYGAYLRHPDGNKIHIVRRGDLLLLY